MSNGKTRLQVVSYPLLNYRGEEHTATRVSQPIEVSMPLSIIKRTSNPNAHSNASARATSCTTRKALIHFFVDAFIGFAFESPNGAI